jgi:hypothetical protein
MHWTLTSSIFGSEDIRPDVDVIIILGNLTIYTNIHPKLLLIHYSGMLANVNYSDERRNQIARDLYHHLRPISGRRGYEVVQRGGFSGKISIQSNHDLLDCIHDVPGMCRRRLHGVLIMRGVLTYYLVYRNVCSQLKSYT